MLPSTELELGSLASAVEKIPPPSLQTVATGRDRAQGYMLHLIRNEKVNGVKRKIGPGILKALHRETLFYYPGWAGHYRVDDRTRIGGVEGRRLVKAEDLEKKGHLFECWLEREVDLLREEPENLYGALRVAAAAHYGVVGELHPFDDGNGRVARTLANGILMMNTREGFFHGFYIIPVPLLRDSIDIDNIVKLLVEGREPKLAPYLQSLVDVDKSWKLNPFEIYLASKWIDSINELLIGLEGKYKKTKGDKNWKQRLNDTERDLVDKIMERRRRLFAFIEANRSGNYPADPVPDFFALQHMRVDKA